MREEDQWSSSEQTTDRLWKMIPISPSRITPYRAIVLLRLVILIIFLRHRLLMSPAMDHNYVLWLISFICDTWFAFSWILDLSQKFFPVLHQTQLHNLSLQFETQLAPIDLFVSSVDPSKEPPIVTANTILSILSVDYPAHKLNCYVSDDGASMLLFNTLLETAEFARKWVPFCKKHCIEPRAPEFYFSQSKKMDYISKNINSSFVKERNFIQRDYEEFKVKINALVAMEMRNPSNSEKACRMRDGTPWPGNITEDHPSMIEVILGREYASANVLPQLVYVSREKRPGYDHHKKAGAMNALVRASAVLSNAPFVLNLDCDHYINNSKALREAMCFHMDSQLGKRLCFVQFPQRFYGVDTGDRYANHNNVFFDSNLKGLDGIQGPMYIGTGCVFNRRALYGYFPPMSDDGQQEMTTMFDHIMCWVFSCNWCPSGKRKLKFMKGDMSNGGKNDILKKRFGSSDKFVASIHNMEDGGPLPKDTNAYELMIKEAIAVINCDYEEKTEWGKEIAWIYGSVTEDILTGFKMHCRGWKSVYCIPKRAAFKGTAPINLSDRLHQVLRWSLGSVEIFMSRHCPVWYALRGGKLKLLQRLAYINITTYPFSSIPLLAYCTFPSIQLLIGQFDFITPTEMNASNVWFMALFLSIIATILLEVRWSNVTIKNFWCVERFWMICGVSAYIFAVIQGLLKVIIRIDTKFTVTSKTIIQDQKYDEFRDLYLFKWTTLLILPTIMIVLNIAGLIVGLSEAMNNGFRSWGFLLGRLFIPIWVILHLYPFLRGLMGRNNISPIIFLLCVFLIFMMKDYHQT